MLPFSIERLIISGLGKTDSEIDFSNGLTFVVVLSLWTAGI